MEELWPELILGLDEIKVFIEQTTFELYSSNMYTDK